jgi:hypothetical protein
LFGKSGWASSSALNLQDAVGLTRLSALLPGKPRHEIGHLRLSGLKAHLFLMIRKPHGTSTRQAAAGAKSEAAS